MLHNGAFMIFTAQELAVSGYTAVAFTLLEGPQQRSLWR
jgi:hypothetical protein